MPRVAGVDSSTQSCKVVIRDAATGKLIRQGKARHPDGTEVDPEQWWTALQEAVADAGGIDDVEAISVAGQQHGMVCLDEDGNVIRPALLWNDVRSAAAATSLVLESGDGNADDGARYWAETTGTVPVASLTVTKLRWLAEHEPSNAARVAAVCLPHDWLSWRLAGYGPGTGREGLAALHTDRSDASGTGYYSPAQGKYLPEVVQDALGSIPVLPTVLGPAESSGRTPAGALIGPGAGDNAAAALGVGAMVGDIVVSLGTSGTVFAVSDTPTHDPSGLVAGFADATGNFLPLACTLNATRIFDATAAVLGLDLTELADLALTAPSGSEGLSLVPYFEGERTPNLPHATGLMQGITLTNYTRANLARAAFEGVVCSLADGLAAIQAQGVTADRIILVGGGAQSTAVQQIAAGIFGLPVVVPAAGEYVADGAARQAAATLTGEFPEWHIDAVTLPPVPASQGSSEVLARYRRAAALLHPTLSPA
ncbi:MULTISPECIES: xylulokinase [unclassified Arthrobacter]|uniref:xylulokinase n=1 Tax=unclassified Arthrobacter TaxID=235627 RepID=UPI001491722F|nr:MULTISPECIES: xylulokinase [unclassified Arthrobacter]MBE0010295.1 xylulokinase [Arthrobacter sp. AET 35A]NOJ64172.1 xylulokinase [Arthrobacter sp. 147(2020)]